jgi:hypothetical protein
MIFIQIFFIRNKFFKIFKNDLVKNTFKKKYLNQYNCLLKFNLLKIKIKLYVFIFFIKIKI